MIDDSTCLLTPMDAAVLGIWAHHRDTCGDQIRLRKQLQRENADLSNQLQAAETLHHAIKQQRGIINDKHQRLVAVTKALQNRPS